MEDKVGEAEDIKVHAGDESVCSDVLGMGVDRRIWWATHLTAAVREKRGTLGLVLAAGGVKKGSRATERSGDALGRGHVRARKGGPRWKKGG
jgi:hypothetical protein